MAYSYIWPPTLPQAPQKGFTESGGALIVRTQPDMGVAKQRRRGRSPNVLNVNFILTTAQTEVFEDFVNDSLQGVKRFGFPHPRKGTIEEVRIIPVQEGTLYNFSYLAPGYWSLSLQLEILP